MRLEHRFVLVATALALAMPDAEAACRIIDVRPTDPLPTMHRPQTFSFVATNDCVDLQFSALDGGITHTPVPGDAVGADRRQYTVALTETEWRSVARSDRPTFRWTVGGRSRGVVATVTTTNDFDVDRDGWTRRSGDAGRCDHLPARNPGMVDVMGNGVDDDCDGNVDNTRFEDPVAEISAPTYDRPSVGDLDADGIVDFAFGYPSGNGNVYVVYGPTRGSLSAHDFSALVTTTSEYIGGSVAIGDADGDGIDDLATGSLNPIDADEIRTYLLLGPVTAERRVADAEAFFDMPDSGATDVDIVPDFDGDGTGDVVVGALRIDGEDSVYVGSGSSCGTVDLETSATYTFLGSSVGMHDFAIGDATGDGIADLALVGGGSWGGDVYLMEGGTAAGTYDVASAARAVIDDPGARGLASGDYDGDGALDIITGDVLGGTGEQLYFGAAYAFLGPFSGMSSKDDAVATWTGLGYLNHTGEDVAAGDVDGDGSLDVLIGAPGEDSSAGAVYLQLGFVSGSVSVASLPTFSPYVRERPSPSWGEAGAYVNAIPDWDGDGAVEVGVSSGNGGAMVVYESGALF